MLQMAKSCSVIYPTLSGNLLGIETSGKLIELSEEISSLSALLAAGYERIRWTNITATSWLGRHKCGLISFKKINTSPGKLVF